MKTFQIEEKKALEAYQSADEKGKQLLESLYGKDAFVQPDQFESVPACVAACGKEYDSIFTPDVLRLPAHIVAALQLTYIAEAYNGGVIDFADQKTKLWFPWVNRVSGCGLSLGDVHYHGSSSTVAPRLCFKEKALAEKAFKKFPEVFEAYFKGVSAK